MLWILAVLAVYALFALYLRYKPIPARLHGPEPRGFTVPAGRVGLHFDLTRYEGDEPRRSPAIVDLFLERLRAADQAVLDVFLVDLHGSGDQPSRPDTRRLVETVRASGVELCVLADPVNTHYRTRENPPFAWLEEAGARVVEVDLSVLRHNNLLYGPLYALLAPLLPRGRRLPDPVRGEGRVSPYALATAVAARADHRKVLVTRSGDGCGVLVASANLSDSTAFYDNVAVTVDDDGVAAFVLEAERALARASGADIGWTCAGEAPTGAPDPERPPAPGTVHVTPLMGAPIGRALLRDLARAGSGDRLVVGTLFLSSRPCIRELLSAHHRGAHVHVVLDDNQESFGAEAGGFPNRVVAAELLREAPGMDVRWHRTDAEFHTKFVYLAQGERRIVHAGSANLTRRALLGTNLETNLRLDMPADCDAARSADRYVDALVDEASSRPAAQDADVSRWQRVAYPVLESIGLINC